MARKRKEWWRFVDDAPGASPAQFRAEGFERIGRLYYPICNQAGMLSSVTPRLQGSPTAGQNRFLGLPLSAEDLPHTLVHRDFWLAEEGREPFSLAGCSPDGLRAHLRGPQGVIEAGPGWFALEKDDPRGRFRVRAALWCPADVDAMIECMLVEVVNTSPRPWTLHPYAAIPIYARSADDLRDHRHVTALLHRCCLSVRGVTVTPTMSFDERGHRFNDFSYAALALGPGGRAPAGIWATQVSFLGDAGNYAAPQAVWNLEMPPGATAQQLNGKEALGGFRFAPLRLAPGAKAEYLLVSGMSDNKHCAEEWSRLFSAPRRARKSLEATRAHWAARVSRVAFDLPDADLGRWLTWVGFQPILRQIYGNSFLPEFDYGRGGKGWRDLWQDCLALLLYDPKPVRAMLCHNFGGVRIDGSNATIIAHDGGFVADRNNIPRTWMDHGCWPTHTTLLYIDQSGDLDFVLKKREYFRDPQVHRCRKRDAAWTEAYGRALRTRRSSIYRGSLLEHMLIQNVTAFYNVGEHNLCRLEGADWNDGLDMAPERGESVAFSAFYAWNLDRLADLALTLNERGVRRVRLATEVVRLLDRIPGGRKVSYASAAAKRKRFEEYLADVERDVSGVCVDVATADLAADLRAKSRDLVRRIGAREWVSLGGGRRAFNGYYDNRGRKVEGRSRKGVRMTLTGQVFPLMAGIADEKQVDDVIRSARTFLRDKAHGGVKLNTDFKELQPDLGRAFSFNYGEKENGAVFSHMAVMYACALYQRRRSREAREVWHALYRMATDSHTARIFPCIPEYFNADGRGMYGFLTGSASWMIYLLLTQAFGLRGRLGDLVFDPQLRREDFGDAAALAVRTSFAGRDLLVRFENSDRLQAGKYRVGEVLCGRQGLPMQALPDGGARIDRRVIEALPASRRTTLRVRLARR